MATLAAAHKDMYSKKVIFHNKVGFFSFFKHTLYSDFMKLALELWTPTPAPSYWAIQAVPVCNPPQKPIK